MDSFYKLMVHPDLDFMIPVGHDDEYLSVFKFQVSVFITVVVIAFLGVKDIGLVFKIKAFIE